MITSIAGSVPVWRYSDRPRGRLAASVSSRCDSHDNAVTAFIIGLCKTEVIRRQDRRRHHEAVELANSRLARLV
jgi:hypothetical protein